MHRITDTLIEKYQADFHDEFARTPSKEYVTLFLQDLVRKGCDIECGVDCRGCTLLKDNKCPLNDWQERHPEFVNDDLAKRLKELEDIEYGRNTVKPKFVQMEFDFS